MYQLILEENWEWEGRVQKQSNNYQARSDLLNYRPTLLASPESFMGYFHQRQSWLAKILFLALPMFLQGSIPMNLPRGKVLSTLHFSI